MAGRRQSVRTTDLVRFGKWIDARGLKPVAADALPGGTYRLHFVAPEVAPDALPETEEERAAWDAALR